MPQIKKKNRKTIKKHRNITVILITIILTIAIVWIASNLMSYLKGEKNAPNDSSNSNSMSAPVYTDDTATESQIIEPIINNTPTTDDTAEQISATSPTNTTTQNTLASTPKESTISKDKQLDDTMNISVYFIKISQEGKIMPIKYTRTVKKTVALLTTTLRTLLEGPTQAEQDSGAKSYIPVKSKILGVKVKNNTAFINVNEEFQFNEHGYPGMLAQLYQIVYTTTEISSIKDVQILVNGVVRQFANSEGRIETTNPITKVYLQSQNY